MVEARVEMEQLQSQLQSLPVNDQLVSEERAAVVRFANLSRAEEEKTRQKSRELKIQAGDSNCAYFYQCLRSKEDYFKYD